MNKDEQIRQALKRLASDVGPDSTLLAQVLSVNEEEFTCDLYDEETEMEYPEVYLRPVIDGKECVTIIPKIDSWVLAVRIEDSEDWVIISVGEAEKVHLKCDQIVINGGEKGGLVNWPNAKAQHDLVKQFIDAVKQACNTPVTEPGNGAPSAFQAALNGAIEALQSPSFDDLEDTKVKH